MEIPQASHKRSVELLLDAAGDDELLRDLIASCSPRAREALAFLLEGGGWATVDLFSFKYGERRPLGAGAMEREKPWRSPVNPTEELWYKGLILESSRRIEGKIVPTFEIPEDFLPVLEAELPVPRFRLTATECECVSSPYTLVSDFTVLLAYLYNRKGKMWAGRHPGKKDMAALAARFGVEPDESLSGKLGFLLAIATEFGFVKVLDGKASIGRDETVGWLDLPFVRAKKSLVKMWLGSRKWNDLCRLPEIRCGEDLFNDVLGTRKRFLERLLMWTAPGKAYRVEEIVSGFREWAMDFQRPSGDYNDWDVFGAVSGERLSGRDRWEDVEGRLLESLLTRTMPWLGLSASCDGCFSWTAEGRRIVEALLSGQETASSQEDHEPTLQLAGELSFVLAWHAAPRQVFRACRVADWLGRKQDGVVFAFTRASLKRALSRGITLQQVLDFLEDAGGHDAASRLEGALRRLLGR